MRKWGYIVMASVAALAVSACGGNTGEGTRDFIRVVGSSTVSPFAEIIAEAATKAEGGIKSPVIESTGTGAGMKLFCAGIGSQHPDITMASRRMKKSEFE
ncbi:MAG: hypothetical protein RIQ28_220, partial [Pseudomonadota bacterium]